MSRVKGMTNDIQKSGWDIKTQEPGQKYEQSDFYPVAILLSTFVCHFQILIEVRFRFGTEYFEIGTFCEILDILYKKTEGKSAKH